MVSIPIDGQSWGMVYGIGMHWVNHSAGRLEDHKGRTVFHMLIVIYFLRLFLIIQNKVVWKMGAKLQVTIPLRI